MLLLSLLLYYFWAGKWDWVLGGGPDEATNRRGGGGDGGEGEEKGEEGGQAIQLKPASKCSYCFLGFEVVLG